jgi:hypothetical protein
MSFHAFGVHGSAPAGLVLAALASFHCGGGSAAPSPPSATHPACVDASLTSLAVPNASLGDAGVTVADCYTCMQTACQSQLAACNEDCTCHPAAASIPACLAAGMDNIGECSAGLQFNTAGGGVIGCLTQNCIRTCSGLPGGG